MTIKAGDIFSFTARDGSFGMVKTLRVDTLDDLPTPEPIVHLLVYSPRSIFPPNAAYLSDAKPFIAHLPLLQSGVAQSGRIFIGYQDVSDAELEAYWIWRDAFLAGKAGVFDLTIDDAIAAILEALGKRPAS
ncbi:MAG: hypothetical protein ACK42Y_09840 [Candidatus Thermochlorobacter sp.]